MMNKPFYNLKPEILSIMTRQENMFEGFVRFTTQGARWRWCMYECNSLWLATLCEYLFVVSANISVIPHTEMLVEPNLF